MDYADNLDFMDDDCDIEGFPYANLNEKIALHYTEEMQHQDALWKTESEDLNTMLSLYEKIMCEAKQYGFNGVYETDICNNEAVICVFDNEEERQKLQQDEEPTEFCFGYCKPLINCLEKYYLNS